MSQWNFADVWETVARVRGDGPAVEQGDRRQTWSELDARANGVAAALLAAGLGQQAKVAQYHHNGPAYLESVYASFKAGLVPVNTNYRYTPDELEYLWANADVEAVTFDAVFLDRVVEVRRRLDGHTPGIRLWLAVGATEDLPEWVTPYEQAATAGGPGQGVRGAWGRSGDDLLLIYTGGTTGMPKGVMWRQDDLCAILNRTGEVRYPAGSSLDDVARVLETPSRHPWARMLPGPPLMHGTALFTAFSVLSSGGSIVLTEGHHFSAPETLETITRERVTQMSIVGDAFARPLLTELDLHPDRYDLSTLWLIISSGVMWSAEVRAGLLRHNPRLTLVDSLGSSEALGIAVSTSGKGTTPETAGFQISADARVLAEDGREVTPGSGQQGLLALSGRGPVGYYKDPDKSAATFRLIDGRRWMVPGDVATVAADGTVTLLGRGSGCINTGGEKVFPEEVEEVLKQHPAVRDAVVVGVPSERFGEMVVAVVEAQPESSVPDPDTLVAWVRERLADYKSPRRVLAVDTIGRAPNGKVDYQGLKRYAAETVAAG